MSSTDPTATAPNRYPGQRLGLPETGQGSVARPGRRIAGLVIDWGIAVVISLAFFSYDSWATLTAFVIMQVIFIPTIGGSIGHRIMGLRVVPLSGGWIGLWRPVVRTVLLALVIPAAIWDADQRGLHDKAAGSVLIRY